MGFFSKLFKADDEPQDAASPTAPPEQPDPDGEPTIEMPRVVLTENREAESRVDPQPDVEPQPESAVSPAAAQAILNPQAKPK